MHVATSSPQMGRPGRARLNLTDEERHARRLEQARRGGHKWRARKRAEISRHVVMIEVLQARLRAAGLSDEVTDADIAALAMTGG